MKYWLIITFGTEIFQTSGPMGMWDTNKVTSIFESSSTDDTASSQLTSAENYSTGYFCMDPTAVKLQTSPFGCPASQAFSGGCQ